MPKDYALFDLDGTLLDSLPLIEQTFRHAFAKMCIPWNDGAVMKTVGLPLRDACRQFAGDRWQELFDCYINHQQTIHDTHIRVFPGTRRALEEIQRLVKGMAVVTSKRRPMALRGLTVTGLDRYMRHLVALEDAAKPKPNPEPVLRGLEMLGARPEKAVFIGDSCFDILSGRAAGVLTVGVGWGMAGPDDLLAAQPDHVVRSWDELVSLLSSLD